MNDVTNVQANFFLPFLLFCRLSRDRVDECELDESREDEEHASGQPHVNRFRVRHTRNSCLNNKQQTQNDVVLWVRRKLHTFDPDIWVAMVSTVVTPSEIRAGIASMLIQNETQDRITMRMVGTYVWSMKKPYWRSRWKLMVKHGYSPLNINRILINMTSNTRNCSSNNQFVCTSSHSALRVRLQSVWTEEVPACRLRRSHRRKPTPMSSPVCCNCLNNELLSDVH